MRKYFFLILLCLVFVACKTANEEIKEPEKVKVYVGIGSSEYLDMKIVYKDDNLPVQKFELTESGFIEIYNTRTFTIKVRRSRLEDYTSFYVDDFTEDETFWSIFHFSNGYYFKKS